MTRINGRVMKDHGIAVLFATLWNQVDSIDPDDEVLERFHNVGEFLKEQGFVQCKDEDGKRFWIRKTSDFTGVKV